MMNPKLLLKVFSVVLLTVVQVVGTGGVGRGRAIVSIATANCART